MGDRRKITKQLRRDHKKQLPEVDENILHDDDKMGRAKSDQAGTSKESKDTRKKKPTKERWLLTRKTWRYMADAGRRLIPEGVQNRPEDIPKIESYFQHVCSKEPRFLLWRKSSYPGALGFRSHYRKNRNRKKGGSYREKASSADEAEEYMRLGKGLMGTRESGAMIMAPTTSGRFDVQRLRQEFLQGPSTSTTSTGSTGPERQEKPERPKSFLQKFSRLSKPLTRSPDIEEHEVLPYNKDAGTPTGSLDLDRSHSSVRQDPEIRTPDDIEEIDQQEFIDTLTRYLKQEEGGSNDENNSGNESKNNESDEHQKNIDFQKLLDQLRKNLAVEFSSQRLQERSSSERHHQGGIISTRGNVTPSVHFEGDHQQKMLLETLNRYFGKTTNRQKVISDLLTDRKLLEKLYFDLRRTRGFRGRSSGGGGSTFVPQYRLSGAGGFDRRRGDDTERAVDEVEEPSSWKRLGAIGKPVRTCREGNFSPPPLIEVQHETEPVFDNRGTQTESIPPTMMAAIEEELRKARDKAREDSEGIMSPGGTTRRRSSVDHDDVSPSVSDTIKRYLRMARKKSLDSDKVDRFKRVNYDRNLRNIKPKGEITKPGDDDGLNKGSQTDESWIDALKELKLDDILETSDVEVSGGNEEISGSRITSSRSSVDIEDGLLSPLSPTSPTQHKGILSSGQSFLSSLLHGLQHHQATQGGAGVAVGTSPSAGAISGHPVAAGAMQKSKSSSSVVQHGKSLVSKKIWKSRSKSQTRAATTTTPCTWTPQGHCVWSNVGGRQVILTETTLLDLSEVERFVLQKVALAKLQALNLGVNIHIPNDMNSVTIKPKRRVYLLKRKALTTGFFDTARGKEVNKDKESSGSGVVFGISLGQCLENDRAARGSRSDQGRADDESPGLRRQSHHGSRSSFSSLIETTTRAEESGSCENLMSPLDRMAGSAPGLLDLISCGSTMDMAIGDREPGVPQIVKAMTKHIETYGLHIRGIFRISSSQKKVRQIREEFDYGKEILLTEDHCPHAVANLLKEYFRDLPEPLLCKELYSAFLLTQKIRNRRLQYEALQHLVQLLPVPNRDTLWYLLNFLNVVALNASIHNEKTGKVEGNMMDSYNLATLFAPNIFQSIKQTTIKELTKEVAEEHIDGINVVRSMIDHNNDMFQVSAELLDEVYVHMMDSHPEALDMLLRKRDAGAEEFDEPESSPLEGGNSETSCRTQDQEGEDSQAQERRVWSREEFLHETAGMGGPDMAMRPRNKERDRGRERSSKKRSGLQDDSASICRAADDPFEPVGPPPKPEAMQKTRSVSVDSGNITSYEELPSSAIMFKVIDDQERRQSSPVMTGSSGVITASLKIPVPGAGGQAFALNLDDGDIPFIEDGSGYTTTEGGRQQMTIGLVRGTAISSRSHRQRSASGSDSSQTSMVIPITGSMALVQGCDSAMGSSATFSSPPRNTTPSVCSSSGPFSSTPSWASTPPTSPDATVTTVNYIPDDPRFAMPTRGSPGEDPTMQTARFSIPAKSSTTYQRGTSVTTKEIAPVMLQKVTFTSTSELQQIQRGDAKSSYVSYHKSYSPGSSGELPKSASTSAVMVNKKVEFEPERDGERDRKLTTSISSIGGAVMRSKTADIERMLKLQKDVAKPKNVTPESSDDKKKYAKRRYTDSRHQTRHIPDAESLQAAPKTPVSSSESSESATRTAVRRGQQPGSVWKRRELIASDPKEHETFL